MKKSAKLTILAAVAGASGLMLGASSTANASILPAGFDTVYADNFAAPAVNVNAALGDPNSIVGNIAATATGLDGGSSGAGAAYIGVAQPAAGTGTPDAVWDYSGSGATITSPTANIATSGTTMGEDGSTIDNLSLPLAAVIGTEYDLEITLTPIAATGGHGFEVAFLNNNGNAHLTSGQAITNNDSVGAVVQRDALASGNNVQFFEGLGTGGTVVNLTPAQDGTAIGGALTVDILLTETSATASTMSWYLNGVAQASNISVANGSITDISFGDNRDAGGTLTNFSLTASPVPEPASFGMLAIGGLAALRRRRSSAK